MGDPKTNPNLENYPDSLRQPPSIKPHGAGQPPRPQPQPPGTGPATRPPFRAPEKRGFGDFLEGFRGFGVLGLSGFAESILEGFGVKRRDKNPKAVLEAVSHLRRRHSCQ